MRKPNYYIIGLPVIINCQIRRVQRRLVWNWSGMIAPSLFKNIQSINQSINTNSETMADEALAKAGLHFDELNKIRVLEPESQQQTTELKEECKEFVDSE